MNRVSIIAAIAENYAIGDKQDLLWRLPQDMKRFKELTTGHTVVMGRKTFESLPKGALPNRKNVVLTTQPDLAFADCLSFSSLTDAMESCKDDGEIFIIGGATVYKQALEIADTMYLTWVHHSFEGVDTFFPEIDLTQWKEVEHQDFPADEKHAYPYTFSTYEKRGGGE